MKVEYQNHYLTDNDVANFARLSFAKLAENFTPEQNNNLIRFLARGMQSGDWEKLIDNMIGLGKIGGVPIADVRKQAKDLAVYLRKIPEHWVPFGHPHISLRMQAPIAIARQLFKHKIGMIESEESRRYIKSEPIIYIPEHFRAAPEGSIKQGSAGIHVRSDQWRTIYSKTTQDCVAVYLAMIDDGVAPEMARLVLPQGAEVHWALTGSLFAFSNLYNQRSDGHAQKESQVIAAQVNDIIAPLYPVSWAALTQGAY